MKKNIRTAIALAFIILAGTAAAFCWGKDTGSRHKGLNETNATGVSTKTLNATSPAEVSPETLNETSSAKVSPETLNETSSAEVSLETLNKTSSAEVSNNLKGKSLVVYFSVPETDGIDASSGASRIVTDGKVVGSTQYVAGIISEATGSDLFEIKTVKTYPGSHKALINAAKVEIDSDARPQLATHIGNLEDYDVVFVGFPNWWYDMPMPLYTFFDEYDFSGKTIIPFCTHGGSGFSDAIETIRGLEKNATVLDGYEIYRNNVAASKEGILKWIKSL